ncbi:hypothetical protein Nepgr_015822 [Nepenthes gracilis]|uniref:Uncharacterized protein n=1 Tax=Nepenthes gracilis TaxID=150966 RepID=A0AAD3XRN2_NEPGR|nr:hypothetical protein Nepgr_015822 [Nepenthes gracilis]
MNQPQRQLIGTVMAEDLQEPSGSIHDHKRGTGQIEHTVQIHLYLYKHSNSPGNNHIQHRKPDQLVASWQSGTGRHQFTSKSTSYPSCKISKLTTGRFRASKPASPGQHNQEQLYNTRPKSKERVVQQYYNGSSGDGVRF